MTPADRTRTDDVATLADMLARTYGAGVLARALLVRLRLDGRGELAAPPRRRRACHGPRAR